jgi:hypothetical protein
MIQVLARLLKWLPGNLSHPYYSHYIIVITIYPYRLRKPYSQICDSLFSSFSFTNALAGLAANDIIQRTTGRLDSLHSEGVHVRENILTIFIILINYNLSSFFTSTCKVCCKIE